MSRNDCVTVIDRDTGRLPPLPTSMQQPNKNGLWYSVTNIPCTLCTRNGTGGESSKVTYDSGISSGPQGGMVTNRCKCI